MRPATVKDYEKLQAGGEPVWPKGNSQSLSSALNWYNSFSDYKESKSYALQYLKERKFPKEVVEAFSSVNESKFLNVGFICRMYMRGAPIPINRIQKELMEVAKTGILTKEPTETQVKINLQDRLQDRCKDIIGELEGVMDNCLTTKDFKTFNPYEWMTANQVKSSHTRAIVPWLNKRLLEIRTVIQGRDAFISEAYSNLTKSQWKEYEKLLLLFVSDCERITQVAKVVRKPRKKKEKSVDKILANVQYKKSDSDYKLVSIDPREILGSTQVWVFNTKTRKLGVYHSENNSGFGIKGTTILNCAPAVQKILRKPEEILPKILKATKPELKKIMSSIATTESELAGRLNSDTIIIRVIK